MINYKQWILLAKQEWNGIVIDYTDPEGNYYSEPFCFQTLDQAIGYGRACIDRLIRLKSKSLIQLDS